MRSSDDMRSFFVGFLFTGTALLPICPRAKYSATSSISVRCRLRISTAILSSVVPTSASEKTNSAYLSRGTICVATRIGSSPSLFAASF